jgi:hypothetical protein
MSVGQRRNSTLEARDAQSDLSQRARLAAGLGIEQRELSAPGMRADEREAVRALDDVHPEMGGREACDHIAVFNPECYVVEPLEFHAAPR